MICCEEFSFYPRLYLNIPSVFRVVAACDIDSTEFKEYSNYLVSKIALRLYSNLKLSGRQKVGMDSINKQQVSSR